jgi:hypothetical protein
VSSILDALKKAGDDQGPVRSPLSRTGLYAQTQIKSSIGSRSGVSVTPGSGRSHSTLIAAGAGVVLLALVGVGVVAMRGGNTETAGPETVSASPTTTSAPVAATSPATTRAPEPAPEARPPRFVDNYLSAQLLPTVPIHVDIGPTPPPAVGGPATAVATDPTLPATPPEPAKPEYLLEGIVFDSNNPMAIINGVIVSPGDYVNGATVLEIHMNSVVLNVNGEQITLGN